MSIKCFASSTSLKTVRSLAEALRNKASPLVLDLTASEDLQCRNLLCEKVGEPCICRLSYVLESLADVRQVRLANNKLTSLPPAIWKLRQLTHLDLSNNRLDSIPDDIAGLANLQELDLQGNEKLQSVPPDVFKLEHMKVLKLPESLERNKDDSKCSTERS